MNLKPRQLSPEVTGPQIRRVEAHFPKVWPKQVTGQLRRCIDDYASEVTPVAVKVVLVTCKAQDIKYVIKKELQVSFAERRSCTRDLLDGQEESACYTI